MRPANGPGPTFPSASPERARTRLDPSAVMRSISSRLRRQIDAPRRSSKITFRMQGFFWGEQETITCRLYFMNKNMYMNNIASANKPYGHMAQVFRHYIF